MTHLLYGRITKEYVKSGVRKMALLETVTTAVQRARAAKEAGITEEVADEVLRSLYSNNKYNAIIQEVKKKLGLH